ncbi:unnamed protein product [Prorocentrum cordatum]|uniref:Uncharacterized protein n=1 Tax=Prorocentrum cordatum TaxID=2364126 RepID=A0ABN9Y7E3_9DINO|nr:unnamed protein product [Polarella glacialis]
MEQVIDFVKRHLDCDRANQVVDLPCAVARDRLEVIGLMKDLLAVQVDGAVSDWRLVPHHAMDAHDSTSRSHGAATESIGRDPSSTFSFMVMGDVTLMQGGSASSSVYPAHSPSAP